MVTSLRHGVVRRRAFALVVAFACCSCSGAAIALSFASVAIDRRNRRPAGLWRGPYSARATAVTPRTDFDCPLSRAYRSQLHKTMSEIGRFWKKIFPKPKGKYLQVMGTMPPFGR